MTKSTLEPYGSGSEPNKGVRELYQLANRGINGEDTRIPGQQYVILAHLSDGSVKPSPVVFASAERAAAFLVLIQPFLYAWAPKNARYSIAIKKKHSNEQ